MTIASFLELKERLRDLDPEAVFFDQLDGAVVGFVSQFNRLLVLYDYAACLDVFMKDGMTHEEAEEWMQFNVVGAWVGTHTPVFLMDKILSGESCEESKRSAE